MNEPNHVYFGWSPEKTETFRWASRKSPKGYGFNAQTAPKQFRWLNPAPPGRVYGQKDLKQAEARIVAYLALAKNLISIFETDANLYIEQGRLVRGHDIERDTPEYTLCKAGIHAAHYDEGPFKFAWDMGVSVAEARQWQAAYHAANPEIRANFHQAVVDQITERGYLTTPLGRKRTFYEALACLMLTGKIGDRQRKDAIAWQPQCIVPDIITTGLLSGREQLGSEVWFHHHGHDSIIWSVPDDAKLFEQVEEVLDQALRIPVTINGFEVVIPRETCVGWSVGEMMDYDGHLPDKREWDAFRKKKAKTRRDDILSGVYKSHLEADE